MSDNFCVGCEIELSDQNGSLMDGRLRGTPHTCGKPAPVQPSPAGAAECCELCHEQAPVRMGLTIRGPMICAECFNANRGKSVKQLMDEYAEHIVAPIRQERDEAKRETKELRGRLGKPRCLTCNSARMTNCSEFDKCNGEWKYELEERAESAERSLDNARLAFAKKQQEVETVQHLLEASREEMAQLRRELGT